MNQKTVAKRKTREAVTGLPTAPKEPQSTVLSIENEAIVAAFRQHTLSPLDDSLYALQPPLPHLTRSSLHRCLQRHGISRLPEVEGEKSSRKKFKSYPVDTFHIDIDRTSTFAFIQLVKKTCPICFGLFEALIAAVPYKIHTVLTGNGIAFTFPPRYAMAQQPNTSRICSICAAARMHRTPSDQGQLSMDERPG